jgi:hypothetical protein
VARILASLGAIRIYALSGARVVTAEALKKVTLLFIPHPALRGQTECPPHRQPAAVIKVVQNALSDWGSKAVAVRSEPATVMLTPNTLTAHSWAIADPATGALITSDRPMICTICSNREGHEKPPGAERPR